MTAVPESVLFEAIAKGAETPEGTRRLARITRAYLQDKHKSGDDIPNEMLPKLVLILDACLIHLPKAVPDVQEAADASG